MFVRHKIIECHDRPFSLHVRSLPDSCSVPSVTSLPTFDHWTMRPLTRSLINNRREYRRESDQRRKKLQSLLDARNYKVSSTQFFCLNSAIAGNRWQWLIIRSVWHIIHSLSKSTAGGTVTERHVEPWRGSTTILVPGSNINLPWCGT